MLLFVCAALLAPSTEPPASPEAGPLPGLAEAADYHRAAGGFALLVMQNGKVVHEEYAAGRSPDLPSELASGTKSFAGAAAVAAQEDGLLTLDETVSKTITEWASDPRKSKITIRQLLSLSSGLAGGSSGGPPRYAAALEAPTFADPGIRFQYGPNPFQVFGELMRRKLRGETYLDYLRRRILDPIGAEIGQWRVRQGEPHMPSGARFTVRDWALFGELVRRQGKWGEQVVLRPESVAELWKPSSANPRYGLTWWLDSGQGDGAGGTSQPRMIFAAGLGGQKLYVVPSQGLVIARLAPVWERNRPRFDDREFFRRLHATVAR